MKKIVVFLIIVLGVVLAVIFLNKPMNPQVFKEENNTANLPDVVTPPMDYSVVVLDTNFGSIKIRTYDADAPKTVANFLKLAGEGFYNNLTFHRVIKGFMVQGGDPSGNGTGGPGYTFEDELDPRTESYKAGYKKGVVAMANAGPNTNGSQFFIMLEDYPLPNNYTIFGKVIEGQEVVDMIGSVRTDSNDRPLEPVIIEKASIMSVN